MLDTEANMLGVVESGLTGGEKMMILDVEYLFIYCNTTCGCLAASFTGRHGCAADAMPLFPINWYLILQISER